jgi:hypothetical protein
MLTRQLIPLSPPPAHPPRQVELYADYLPTALMPFLASSHFYPLEAAYEVCAARGLVPEMVYVLSRMGSCQQALQLIIERQGDIPAAIQFVQGQADDELWGYLIDWALAAPGTTAQLLDHIGGHINPLKVIERIPLGMQVGLRAAAAAVCVAWRGMASPHAACPQQVPCAKASCMLPSASHVAHHRGRGHQRITEAEGTSASAVTKHHHIHNTRPLPHPATRMGPDDPTQPATQPP